MELRQIEYFHALCEELNFTRAAERCGVSQPALTRAIRLLEDELGGELFHRAGVRTRLSELGAIVRPHLDSAFEQTRIASSQAHGFQTRRAVRLRLGVMCSVAPTDLVPLVQTVRQRHPDLELEIVDADARSLERILREGSVDVVITGLPISEAWPEDLHRVLLHRERFVVVTAPQHRFAELPVVRCADLGGEAFLARIDCEMTHLAEKELASRSIALKTVYRSTRDDWILAMAAAGLGFAFMPERSVQRDDVIARNVVEPEFWRQIGLVTLRGRPHAAAVGGLVREALRTGAWDRLPGDADHGEDDLTRS